MPVQIIREKAPVKQVIATSDSNSPNAVTVTPTRPGKNQLFGYMFESTDPFVYEDTLREFAHGLLEMIGDE